LANAQLVEEAHRMLACIYKARDLSRTTSFIRAPRGGAGEFGCFGLTAQLPLTAR
jgi:hypothetical protein